jgi:surface polysaccharide O-acyltransferase-like enzyme
MKSGINTLAGGYAGKTAPRRSNIELLRIIAMIMIVAHHFAVHSGFDFPADTVTVNRLWIQFIQLGGKIGVDVFVLISGYFLISSAELKTNKVLKLWLQIFTYSSVIFFVFFGFGAVSFGFKTLLKNILPVSFSQWWFASTYFVLYLISPYLNKLLNTLDKKSYQRFLALLTFCWCIIPTFLSVTWQSNELLWFIYLYSLAGYVRLHASESSVKGTTLIAVSSALAVLTFLSAVVFDILGTKTAFFGRHATFFYDMQKIPVLLISLLMFVGFLKIDIGYKPIINIISSATFGVYLIHDNKYVRQFLWETVFKNASFADSAVLIPYSVAVIAVVFAACTAVELLRIYALEKHYMKAVDKFSALVNKWTEKFFSLKFFNRV